MELRHLKYFHALAEELHFGRAAERVHIVQPALSRQIASLEHELGLRLFDRTTRGVELTPAGKALHDKVIAILPAIDDAIDVARMTATGQTGLLEIGYVAAAMWSMLPPILKAHRRRFPNVRFRISELPMAGEHLTPLLDGSLDVAFIRPVTPFRALVFREILREQLVAVLPRDHRCATSEAVDLADLADDRFILGSRTLYPGANEQFVQACRVAGFTPRTMDEGDSPNALYLVAAGFAVALAPASTQHSGIPGVVFKPLTQATLEVVLAVAYRRDDQSESLAAFLDTVDEVVAPRPV